MKKINGSEERRSTEHNMQDNADYGKQQNTKKKVNHFKNTRRTTKKPANVQKAMNEAAAADEMNKPAAPKRKPAAKVKAVLKKETNVKAAISKKEANAKVPAASKKEASVKAPAMPKKKMAAKKPAVLEQEAPVKKTAAAKKPSAKKSVAKKASEATIIGRNGRKITSKLKVIPLGGLEQIGMNITAFEYENSIVVVDCGLSFPEDDMLGIDLVIPDVTYLKENIEKVKGFVITHGHEDHIGALPYILKDINVPIYSTKLTLALITNKLKEHNLVRSTKLKEVKHGQVINLGDFSIEFIKTNHSIQDASALAIYSPAGIVVHTGDFKVDYTPVFGDAIDLQRFAEIGKKGVLALMCDSTNAERPGFTMSEKTVGRVFDNLFSEYKKNRIIIATFASNVDRVQQIINTAYRFGRKVAVEGRSMVNVISTASELGYLRIPENTLIEIDQVKNYPDEEMVLITTGSQGESMAALSRMAASIHKKITIKPNDTIIFSSNPIPGNEKAVSRVINDLSRKGAKVIFQDAHVSGHACQEEIKLIYSLVKPKYAVPVHGEYRHLTAQKHVAEELGIPKENIFLLSSGNVLEMDGESAAVTGKVHTGSILVDGLGVGDVGNIVLRDRQHLAEDGIMIVVMTLVKHSNVVVSGPDIVSRGFVYVRESEDLMEHAREVVVQAMESCVERDITDWSRIKTIVKDALGEYLWKRTKRSPMILPIIMEA